MSAATQRVRLPASMWMPPRVKQQPAPKATRKTDPVKRPFLCLLLRTDDSPEWGALSVIRLHEYTDPKAMREYREALEIKKINWMRSNHFGGTASFRIDTEMRVIQQVVA